MDDMDDMDGGLRDHSDHLFTVSVREDLHVNKYAIHAYTHGPVTGSGLVWSK